MPVFSAGLWREPLASTPGSRKGRRRDTLLTVCRDPRCTAFGRTGLAFGVLGGAILVYMTCMRLFFGMSLADRPLLLLGVLLVMGAIQFLTTGVLSELLTRTYFGSSYARLYVVQDYVEPG